MRQLTRIPLEQAPYKGYLPTLKTFQRTAVRKLIEVTFSRENPGHAVLLSAPTGHGKTIMLGEYYRWCKEFWPTLYNTKCPFKMLVLSPAPVVLQTTRRLKSMFGLREFDDFWVVPYSSLAATLGAWFLEKQVVSRHGDLVETYTWDLNSTPPLIVCDEAQYLMTGTSTRTRIMKSLLEQLDNVYRDKLSSLEFRFLLMSATMAARGSELEFPACATRIPYQFGWVKEPLVPKRFPSWIREYYWDCSPHDHNNAAFRRALVGLKDYIVRVPYQNCGEHFQVVLADFPTREDQEFYETAYERYLADLAALGEDVKGIEVFHIIREFRRAAESVRAKIIAAALYDAWKNHGKAPSAAFEFKPNLVKCMFELIKYGVPREKIAVIWGGLSAKQVAKEDLKRKRKRKKQEAEDKLEKAMQDGVFDEDAFESIFEIDDDEIKLSPEEQQEIDTLAKQIAHLDLSAQTQQTRQAEIDKFQSGECEILLHTFAAGGIGIDLPRDKPELKPREKYVGLIYHDKQFIQSNREARISSIGETNIIITLLAGTIEQERVLPKLSKKLENLRELFGSTRSFASVLVPASALAAKTALEELEDSEGRKQKLIDVTSIEDIEAVTVVENNSEVKQLTYQTTTTTITDNENQRTPIADSSNGNSEQRSLDDMHNAPRIEERDLYGGSEHLPLPEGCAYNNEVQQAPEAQSEASANNRDLAYIESCRNTLAW